MVNTITLQENITLDNFLKVTTRPGFQELEGVSSYVGYKQMYECKCGKKFRNLDALERHYDYQHKDNVEFLYKRRLVNGRYVEEMCSKCHTKKLIFAHVRDDREFCQEQREIINSCYLRICPKCDATRRWRYEKNYKSTILKFRRVSVLTLTFAERYYLDRQEKRRRESMVRNFMKRLARKTNYPIQYVRVLELVQKDDGYHYHYHFLIDMPFVKQEELSTMWNEVSGAPICWIEILKGQNGAPIGITWSRLPDQVKLKNALAYITKYLSNPLGKKHGQDGYQVDYEAYALYIYGSHFIQTFTCIHGQNSSEKIPWTCPKCERLLEYVRTEDLPLPDS